MIRNTRILQQTTPLPRGTDQQRGSHRAMLGGARSGSWSWRRYGLFLTAAALLQASCAATEDGIASAQQGSSSWDAGESGTEDPVCADGGSSDPNDGAARCAPGFATRVVSVTYGAGAGFGQSSMPCVVIGPPHGGGTTKGSTDVVSLGVGGEIVLGFGFDGIADGPGVDFIVFENVFDIGGDPSKPYAELGEVSVSADGVTWSRYPCHRESYPYDGCAGWHPTMSTPENGISPFDPLQAGGEAFDLADVGISVAKVVRIRDLSSLGAAGAAGFDLDAIAGIHRACHP